MSDGAVMILGAPYVFARNKLRKPKHVEAVRMVMRPVLCHLGCGAYYVAKDEESMCSGDVCPGCGSPPKAFQIGAPEQVEVSVHMAFGNLVDVSFLRALGPLSQRQIIADGPRIRPVTSGLVTPPRQR